MYKNQSAKIKIKKEITAKNDQNANYRLQNGRFYHILLFEKGLYRLERLVAYVMLDLAGIGVGRFLTYTKRDEKSGQGAVAIVNLLRHVTALVGKADIAVLVNRYVSATLKQADRSAYTWLGKAHVLAHVDRSHVGRLFGQY